MKESRVNRREYLARTKRRLKEEGCKYSDEEMRQIYDAFVGEIYDILAEGGVVSLSNVGRIFIQKRKGHPVHLRGEAGVLDDYLLLRFAPSHSANMRIRNDEAFKKSYEMK